MTDVDIVYGDRTVFVNWTWSPRAWIWSPVSGSILLTVCLLNSRTAGLSRLNSLSSYTLKTCFFSVAQKDIQNNSLMSKTCKPSTINQWHNPHKTEERNWSQHRRSRAADCKESIISLCRIHPWFTSCKNSTLLGHIVPEEQPVSRFCLTGLQGRRWIGKLLQQNLWWVQPGRPVHVVVALSNFALMLGSSGFKNRNRHHHHAKTGTFGPARHHTLCVPAQGLREQGIRCPPNLCWMSFEATAAWILGLWWNLGWQHHRTSCQQHCCHWSQFQIVPKLAACRNESNLASLMGLLWTVQLQHCTGITSRFWKCSEASGSST